MSQPRSAFRSTISRRRWLASIGAIITPATLSACVGDTDGEPVAESPEDDEGVFGVPFPYVLESAQLNPFAGEFPWSVHSLLFETPAYRLPDGEYVLSDVIADVAVSGPTVRIQYARDFNWWNGEPLSARDRWVAEQIRAHMREVGEDAAEDSDAEIAADSRRLEPPGRDIASIELIDEYSLEYDFTRPIDRSLAIGRTLVSPDTIAAWYFMTWLERIEDASSEDAREEQLIELSHDTIPLDEARSIGYGCSPYELDEISPNRVLLDRQGDHPRSDDLSIERIWMPVAQDIMISELVGQGLIDGWHGTLEGLRVSPPDHVEQLTHFHRGVGTKLAFNWRNRHVNRRGVRRAIAHILPIPDIVEAGQFGEPAELQTGITVPPQQRWLDSATRDALHRYPLAAEVDHAAAMMRAESYELRDGVWIDEDGNEAVLRVRVPMWDRWVTATEILTDAFTSFGFTVELKQNPLPTLMAVIEQGDFDVLVWLSDGIPEFVYDPTRRGVSGLGYDIRSLDADSSRYNKPIDVSIPETPGDVDAGEGDRISMNVLEQWDRIRRPSSEAETAEAIELLTRWWNDALPDLDLSTQTSGVWGNTRDFEWPGEGAKAHRVSGEEFQPVLHMLGTGRIDRKIR